MTPRPYQIVGRDFLAARRFALLADEMRVGKTPQAILATQLVKPERTLVVCPAIAVTHWNREWQKWGGWGFMLAVSYDRFRRHSESFLSKQWDLAIVDECHFAKNPEAQRTKLIYGKGGIGWCAARLWALSGTPAPKHAGELWPMLRAFGATGLSYSAFTREFCTWSWNNKITGTKVNRIPELKAVLAKVMLRRTRKEVAPDMPEISFEFLEVEPFEKVDLKPEALGRLDGDGAFDRDDRIAVAKAKALPLVEEVVEAIESGNLKQTVVFGWHKEPIGAVRDGLTARGIIAHVLTGDTSPATRQYVQDAFLAGRSQVVVANIAAAGTAIDLSAASHGYFLELDWVPGNNMQAANRLVSMQKDEPVTFDIVTAPGTIDDRVQRVLLRRAQELKQLY